MEVQLKAKSILNHFSHVLLFAAPCTVVGQAPRSIGFSRQEYWSGVRIFYKIGLIYTFVPYFDVQTFTENLLKQSVRQVPNTN